MEYKNGEITHMKDPLIRNDSYLGMGPKMTYFYLIHLIPQFDT